MTPTLLFLQFRHSGGKLHSYRAEMLLSGNVNQNKGSQEGPTKIAKRYRMRVAISTNISFSVCIVRQTKGAAVRTRNFCVGCTTFIPLRGPSVSSVRPCDNTRGTGKTFVRRTCVRSVRLPYSTRSFCELCKSGMPMTKSTNPTEHNLV